MKFKREHRRLIAGLAAAALVVTACGGDDDGDGGDTTSPAGDTTPDGTTGDTTDATTGDTTDGTTEGTTDGTEATTDAVCETAINDDNSVESLSELDLSGIEVTIGSKNFTEQYVLGWLTYIAMEEAGATVNEEIDLGGTNVVREALVSGQIDASWEYNGTGWAQHLGITDPPPSDGDVLTKEVCARDLEENGIRWLGRTPFNNTYGFASRPDLVAENGEPFDMQGMADYLPENSHAIVCMESEFPGRQDGLVLFEEGTGFVIPQNQQQILETNAIYQQTAEGACDFGEIFTTDERISTLGLNLVEDPGIMIIYNASLTMSDELFQQAPEAFEALADTITKDLDNEQMLALNGRAVSGETPREVAESYLIERGVIEG